MLPHYFLPVCIFISHLCIKVPHYYFNVSFLYFPESISQLFIKGIFLFLASLHRRCTWIMDRSCERVLKRALMILSEIGSQSMRQSFADFVSKKPTLRTSPIGFPEYIMNFPVNVILSPLSSHLVSTPEPAVCICEILWSVEPVWLVLASFLRSNFQSGSRFLGQKSLFDFSVHFRGLFQFLLQFYFSIGDCKPSAT